MKHEIRTVGVYPVHHDIPDFVPPLVVTDDGKDIASATKPRPQENERHSYNADGGEYDECDLSLPTAPIFSALTLPSFVFLHLPTSAYSRSVGALQCPKSLLELQQANVDSL
jgi:hypothetical protein